MKSTDARELQTSVASRAAGQGAAGKGAAGKGAAGKGAAGKGAAGKGAAEGKKNCPGHCDSDCTIPLHVPENQRKGLPTNAIMLNEHCSISPAVYQKIKGFVIPIGTKEHP